MQNELTIRIAGEAGQGMQTIGAALCKVFKKARFHLFANQDYMSRIRGGNHFLHNIRRNINITVVVHNNQIYGLTKGQASPTTDPGYVTKFQPGGVILDPLHPLEMAIVLGCGFVARAYSADSEHLSWLILEGIKHKGFSLIDVLQPCVSFRLFKV